MFEETMAENFPQLLQDTFKSCTNSNNEKKSTLISVTVNVMTPKTVGKTLKAVGGKSRR